MALSVVMTGSGTLGAIVPGWSITEQCTPVALGDSSGSVGSATLTAKVNSDSRYVQDNAIALTHDTAGTFRGSVQSVSVGNLTAPVEVAGGLAFAVADRTMPAVGLDNTFDHSFLVYGSGTGQVANAYGIATDPFDDAVFVTSYGTVNGVDRYKVIKFSSLGVYISEFGANGTSNGQFTGAMAVAVNPVDGSVYVSDGSQTRIQKFTTADRITYTYSTKWGALGSANGQFGGVNNFNIAADSSGNVYATDTGNLRIQKFNSSGTYQAKAAITVSGYASAYAYGLAVSGSTVYASILLANGSVLTVGTIQTFNTSLVLQGTLTIPALANSLIGIANIAVDGSGNIWAQWIQTTFLIKYDSSGNELFRWQSTYPAPIDVNTNYNLAVNSAGAVAMIFRPSTVSVGTPIPGNYVTEFNYVAVTLSTMLQRYLLACDSTLNGFTFSYIAGSNPNVVVPAWTGDVWTKLKEACAVYAIELALVGTVITVRDAGSLTLSIGTATPKTTSPSNTFGGQEIDITYQSPVAGGGVMYDAAAVNVIWSVDVAQRNVVTITGNTYPTALAQPVPTDTLPIQPGQYYVVDTNGLPVPAATWTAAGGQIITAPGTAPGTITITFIGPGGALSGFVGPFYLSTDRTAAAVATLSIAGPGVICTPGTIQLLTGADPTRTTQQVAFSSASPFIDTVSRAYDRGSWASDAAASPTVDIEFDIPTSSTNGFGRTAGATFTYEGSIYRVTEARFGNVTTHIKATRFTTLAEIDTAWTGQTFGTYDTFWSGYSAGDQQIQPLLTSR